MSGQEGDPSEPGEPDQAPRLAVMRHWRTEVGDVAQTLREAGRRPGVPSLRIVGSSRAFVSAAAGVVGDLGVLCSDDVRPRLEWLARGERRPRPFRLWWNDAWQVARYMADAVSERPPAEVHISFFPELATEMPELADRVLYAPYIFTAPRRRLARPLTLGVCFTGEVDISDRALGRLMPDPSLRQQASEEAWDMAQRVADGATSLVDADVVLRDRYRPESTELYRVLLAAVRNRVRFLLVRAVVDAFPERVKLRGSDWVAAGFQAHRTTRGPARRHARMADYRKYRVSLDLGSKSTHGWMSPRTADVMAVAGGLVRFHSGETSGPWSTVMSARTASGKSGLLDVIDTVLSSCEADYTSFNRFVHEHYVEQRKKVGMDLCGSIVSWLDPDRRP